MAYFISKYAQETKHSGRSPDVDVVGHSDATGDATANDKLSLQRAQAVAGLLAEGGIPRDRLKVSGRGAHDPLYDLRNRLQGDPCGYLTGPPERKPKDALAAST